MKNKGLWYLICANILIAFIFIIFYLTSPTSFDNEFILLLLGCVILIEIPITHLIKDSGENK